MNVNKNQDNILCSVCIANYNGAKVLEGCLNSVFQQDFPFNIEVILHDDASTDESISIVTEKFPTVRLLKSNINVGFCVSNNRMVSQARGKYILLLNNDAELRKDALSVLYNYAVRTNFCGIIGLPQYSMETGELLDMGSILDPFLNSIPNKNNSRLNVGLVIGACMWLPRKLWNELGGFPEWFESLSEDKYLCCCARLKGYPVIALSDSGFDHWVGMSLGGGKITSCRLKTTYRRRALSERNRSFVMFLCYPSPMAYLLIPVHLLLLIFEGLILSAVKKEKRIWQEIYWPCFKALYRNRKKLMRIREKIQNGRRVTSLSFYSAHTCMPHKLIMLMKYGVPVLR